MKTNWFMTTAAAVFLGTLGTGASALSIELNYSYNPPAHEGKINVGVDADGDRYNGSAGGFQMTSTAKDPSGAPLVEFIAWCLDLGTYIKEPRNYEVLLKNDDSIFDNGVSSNGGTPVKLSDNQKDDIQSLFDIAYDDVLGNITSKKYSGGFQLALWNIVYDEGDYSMVTGNFTNDGTTNRATDAHAYANQILAGIVTDDDDEDKFTLLFFESENHSSQNLVAGFAPGDPTLTQLAPVPLPGAGMLLIAGMGALAASSRRRRGS